MTGAAGEPAAEVGVTAPFDLHHLEGQRAEQFSVGKPFHCRLQKGVLGSVGGFGRQKLQGTEHSRESVSYRVVTIHGEPAFLSNHHERLIR